MFRENYLSATAVVLGLLLLLIVSPNAVSDDREIAPAGNDLMEAPVRPQPGDAARVPAGPSRSGMSTEQIIDRQAEANRLACKEWCDNEDECARCRPSGLCGTGYVVMDTWGSPGSRTAWDACKFVASVTMPDQGPPSHPRLPERAPVPPVR